MKRFGMLLLVLALCLSMAGSASAGRMMQIFSTDYYQIYIPGDWLIDTSEQADYWGMLDFGFMYAKDESMMIEARMNFYAEWSQDSLWNTTKDVWEEYLQFLLDDFKEENPKIIQEFKAGKLPGVVLTGTNEYGSYLYGEIMINAYAYNFYFYRLNEDGSINSEITQDYIDLFVSILETFQPTYTNTTVTQ